MTRFTRRGIILAAATTLLLVACDSTSEHVLKLEASQAALTTTNNIETNLKNLSEVLLFLEDFVLFQKSYMAAEGGMTCTAPVIYDEATGQPVGEGVEECAFEASDEEFQVSIDEMADTIVEKLNQYVFVDSQIEVDAGEAVVYLLSPTVFCGIVESEDDGEAPADAEEALDVAAEPAAEESTDVADCQDLLSKVSVRLRFVSRSEGDVEMDILVGDSQALLIHLEFLKASLVAEVDTATLRDVIETVSDAMQDGDDTSPMSIQEMQGRLRLELTRLSAERFSLSFQVLDSVYESFTVDGAGYSLEMAAGTLVAIADRSVKTLSLSSQMGHLSVGFPYQAFVDAWYDEGREEGSGEPSVDGEGDGAEAGSQAPDVPGSMEISVAGLSFDGTLAEANETFSVSNVGLGDGPAVLRRDGAVLVSLDVNPSAGRSFDLEVGLNQAEHVVATVAPLFDVVLAWGLGQIASDLDGLPSELMDETWRVTLDGADAPQIEFMEGDTKDFVRVLAGHVALSSSSAQDLTLSAATGECLAWAKGDEPAPVAADEIAASDEHAFLSALEAGTCVSAQ